MDDDEPVGAADALAIIRAQQASTTARLSPRTGHFFLIWGAVWLLTGLLYFLAGVGVVDPGLVGWCASAVVLLGVVASAVVGVRSGRGVAGRSSRQSLLYGLTWPVVMLGVGVLAVGMGGPAGVPAEALALVLPALFALVVGALYAISGAIWLSVRQFVLGGWIVAVGTGSVFAGLPGNTLVLGAGVGGALLLAGLRETLRTRRAA